MNPRRKFIKRIAALAAATTVGGWAQRLEAFPIQDSLKTLDATTIPTAVQNEELWKYIQQGYTTSSNLINLNNGGVSPQPKAVQEAETRYLSYANEAPSYYMWRVLKKEVEIVRTRLAKLAGCSEEEICINQNTTEGMQTIVSGIDWQPGDEVIVTKQDYSTVSVGWKWLERRYKVKIVWLDLALPFENPSDYIDQFIKAMTAKTRLINITQIINWTGQVVPVKAIRKICEVARARGIFSLVDGAHAFAQLDFKVPDLGCDAFATSLHKWLCAPFGTGMLYIRKAMIHKIWSLMPSEEEQKQDIRKFEHQGTLSIGKLIAIGDAIDFHQLMGIQLKEARLRYLKNYWAKALKDEERIIFHTSLKKNYSCAIALIEINGLEPRVLEQVLFNKFRIHTVTITRDNFQGTRISPNVYTKTEHLDRLLEGIRFVLKNK